MHNADVKIKIDLFPEHFVNVDLLTKVILPSLSRIPYDVFLISKGVIFIVEDTLSCFLWDVSNFQTVAESFVWDNISGLSLHDGYFYLQVEYWFANRQ